VSAGTRRITALTGAKAAQHRRDIEAALEKAAKVLGVGAHEVADAAAEVAGRVRELRKQVAGGGEAKPQAAKIAQNGRETKLDYEATKRILVDTGRLLSVAPLEVPGRLAAIQADVAALEKQLAERSAAGPLSGETLLESGEQVGDVTVVVVEVPGVEANLMRQLIDQVRGKTASSAVLLASRQGDDKVTLVAGISKDLQGRKMSAGEWIRPVAAAVGGGGGGRPDMAQAGGKLPAKLPEALQIAKDTIKKMVAG
jgi:alanyl-tRNA synthetase